MLQLARAYLAKPVIFKALAFADALGRQREDRSISVRATTDGRAVERPVHVDQARPRVLPVAAASELCSTRSLPLVLMLNTVPPVPLKPPEQCTVPKTPPHVVVPYSVPFMSTRPAAGYLPSVP